MPFITDAVGAGARARPAHADPARHDGRQPRRAGQPAIAHRALAVLRGADRRVHPARLRLGQSRNGPATCPSTGTSTTSSPSPAPTADACPSSSKSWAPRARCQASIPPTTSAGRLQQELQQIEFVRQLPAGRRFRRVERRESAPGGPHVLRHAARPDVVRLACARRRIVLRPDPGHLARGALPAGASAAPVAIRPAGHAGAARHARAMDTCTGRRRR